LKPSQLAEAVNLLVSAKLPAYIWGPPGVGKSAVVHQVAKKLKLQVLDLRAVLLDPVDLRGIPVPVKDVVHWRPPAFLPIKGKVKEPGIIFADELAQASPAVQAAFLQGVLDHRIGETELDPTWTWVAASNRQEDRAGANRVITPLLNRFVHLDFEVSDTDWHDWAAQNGISEKIRAFLRFKPDLLMKFDSSRGERSFPTPRSWSFLSRVLEKNPKDMLLQIAKGTVGDGGASEFVTFCEIYDKLPDIDNILANPKTAAVPKDSPSVMYALSCAISARCKDAPKSVLAAVVNYTMRMPQEFSALTFRDAVMINREVVRIDEAKTWYYANRDLINLEK
jgi:hypothetical protein